MKVVVAMSGGVDSSVACALLVEQGHEVIGMTLRLHAGAEASGKGRCCSSADIDDARAVAESLRIPFYVADAEEVFRENVVSPFVRAYRDGTTPVPCTSCNVHVKFGFLLARARRMGAVLATGHYARIEATPEGLSLLRAVDAKKDQTYFLYGLTQESLRHIVFPVGGLSKAEVRQVAARTSLAVAAKPESMELCFVPDGDYASFIERTSGAVPTGEVVDARGKVIARHAGIHHFTVGQRRGLTVASSVRQYVQSIDASSHRVVVGTRDEVGCDAFTLRATSWVGAAPAPTREVTVRIRHRDPGVRATVATNADESRVQLRSRVHGVTPGQAAVFYDGDTVLGGGTIVRATPIN